MGKGGHSGGRNHGASHGHSHFGGHGTSLFKGGSSFGHHSHTYQRIGGARGTFANVGDILANTNMPPVVINGTYMLQGNQMSVIARMNQPLNIATVPIAQFENTVNPMLGVNTAGMEMQPYDPQVGQLVSPPVMVSDQPQTFTEAYIAVAGAKTSPGDLCCAILTIMLGVFCIFPLCFMCCMWWKKMVSPLYTLAPEFYRAVGTFLSRERQCKMLNLTVYDNNFSAEKARILYESLAMSSLTGFTFANGALPCNYLQNQADQFIKNMTPLKSLPFPTQIRWDDMIL